MGHELLEITVVQVYVFIFFIRNILKGTALKGTFPTWLSALVEYQGIAYV